MSAEEALAAAGPKAKAQPPEPCAPVDNEPKHSETVPTADVPSTSSEPKQAVDAGLGGFDLHLAWHKVAVKSYQSCN